MRHRLGSIHGMAIVLSIFAGVARAQDAQSAKRPAPTTQPTPVAPAPAGWKLVWSDEFNGKELDKTKWEYDRGTFLPAGQNQWLPGWGNNELEYYTARSVNSFIESGSLNLRALKESYRGSQYTSARVTTRGKFSKTYGRFEFRARLPTGKGIWPALWLLPEETKYGGWAASGEIDLMEARGQEPQKVLGTLHYGSHWPANVHEGKEYEFPDQGSIADFHVYALEWEPGEIRWFVDDHLYQTQSFWWSCSQTNGPNGVEPDGDADLNPWPAPFNQPFYITMNVAVGGQFLGNPDDATKFPVAMEVDYVRVYDRISGYAHTKPRGPGRLPFTKP